MNVKDQQFINAMHDVVNEKGSDHTAPGQYWGGGEPVCLIGCAAYTAWGIRLTEHALAEEHLYHQGCSLAVAAAGRIAQVIQDSNQPWGVALGCFDLALEMIEAEELSTNGMPCGCSKCNTKLVDHAKVYDAYLAGRRAKATLAQKDHALTA